MVKHLDTKLDEQPKAMNKSMALILKRDMQQL